MEMHTKNQCQIKQQEIATREVLRALRVFAVKNDQPNLVNPVKKALALSNLKDSRLARELLDIAIAVQEVPLVRNPIVPGGGTN